MSTGSGACASPQTAAATVASPLPLGVLPPVDEPPVAPTGAAAATGIAALLPPPAPPDVVGVAVAIAAPVVAAGEPRPGTARATAPSNPLTCELAAATVGVTITLATLAATPAASDRPVVCTKPLGPPV